MGNEVKKFQCGDIVLISSGAFSEYSIVSEYSAMKVPACEPTALSVGVCGATASLALHKVGEMKSGEIVLVTAAAGGTGQFAVQLAKLAGNTVIGTCSSVEKVEYLKSIGCDRAVNYNEEDLNTVLKTEYPKGVDLVIEAVGGPMLEAAVKNIAKHGRIVVIGSISGYEDESAWKGKAVEGLPLHMRLLTKSASLRGFFLPHFMEHYPKTFKDLMGKIASGTIAAGIDPTHFEGLEGIAVAIDYMYARKNIGKLVVQLGTPTESCL